jgi:hypothetical protein
LTTGGIDHLFVSASDGLRVYQESGLRLPNLILGKDANIRVVKSLDRCVYFAVAGAPPLRDGLWTSCALSP